MKPRDPRFSHPVIGGAGFGKQPQVSPKPASKGPANLPPELEALVNEILGIDPNFGPGLEDEFKMLEGQAPFEEMQTPEDQELDLMSTFLSPEMGLDVTGAGENLGITEQGWNPGKGMPEEIEKGVFATPGAQADPYQKESIEDFIKGLLSARGQAPMFPKTPAEMPGPRPSPVPPGLENILRLGGR